MKGLALRDLLLRDLLRVPLKRPRPRPPTTLHYILSTHRLRTIRGPLKGTWGVLVFTKPALEVSDALERLLARPRRLAGGAESERMEVELGLLQGP